MRSRLKHDDSDMRASCASALGKLGLKEAAPHLIECLSDHVAFVKKCCCEALGKIGDSNAIEPLRRLVSFWRFEDKEVKKAGKEAIKNIER